MKYPKFFIGPMTKNVIDAIIKVSNETNTIIGLIPSRRQIDFDGGYVGFNTYEFISYVRRNSQNIIIQRDHSGIGQGKLHTGVHYDHSSLRDDAICDINLIHVDPWKSYKDYTEGLRETINNILYVNAVNPHVMFEVGTEEALRPFSNDEFYKLLTELKYELGEELFGLIKYAVVQSGTKIIQTENVGTFSINRLQEMTSICKEFSILSKEHNGDYLSADDIEMRFSNGLDAINIAPEFGVMETDILLSYIDNNDQLNTIYNICHDGNNWKKWIMPNFDFSNKQQLIRICGHYHNDKIKQILELNNEEIINKLVVEIRNKLKI